MHGVRRPQPAVDHELHRVRRVVVQGKQADRARCDAKVLRQALGGGKAETAGTEARAERIQVHGDVVRNGHQEVTSAPLVAQEKVLRPGAGQRRHQPLRFRDRHDRRMLDAQRLDTVIREKGGKLHRAVHFRKGANVAYS